MKDNYWLHNISLGVVFVDNFGVVGLFYWSLMDSDPWKYIFRLQPLTFLSTSY
jgi:hypothetical protein